MIIFPAIDLFEKKAVRLYKGRYDEMTVYSDNPPEIALDFKKQGASHVHIVDLEGAKYGSTPNFEVVCAIKEQSGLFCEVGGGVRSEETVEKYISAGIDRVILGTAAVEDEDFLISCVKKYGDKIAVGADVKDGFVMMDMASPVLIAKMEDIVELDRLYDIMGSEYDQSIGLNPYLISTGLPDIMMPVGSREELANLAPDMKLLSDLSAKYKVTGVHAFTLDAAEGVTCHCRNFAPLYDIDEEAATGTSNGALTYYLYLTGKIKAPARLKIVQGEAMNRPSVIMTSITEDPETGAVSIKVGGRAVILAEGEINL
ncbi:MAG: PhzF family phenazine biosynthesis isomerase [Firmicutes bacterium]|nr:PhzF family phenazine biosynthesis isomerase [Bacillota bacterium]